MDYDVIDEDELVEDTTIDRHNLEEHWEEHTAIHNKWAKRFRKAERLRNKAETDYRLIKADLFKRGRDGEYDFEGSMTDKALSNWVENHPEFISALRKRNKYTSIVGLLQGIFYTLNDRKLSLEYESKLLLGGIYAEPKISDRAKEESRERKSEKGKRAFSAKMKAKRKKSTI